ncbi:MAG: Gfo/Idh/MocA family oxidoreductase [Victivallales bacterium]|nr:Gfo/Idh/MocA family oxidoreductase [Victivallales bacterium]
MEVLIIGSGMFTNDVILPTAYQLRREGVFDKVSVCATGSVRLRELSKSREISEAFPGFEFTACPSLETDPSERQPKLYEKVLADFPKRQAVVVAVPDDLHFPVLMEALRREQNVLCVKPLVLTCAEAAEIERTASENGLFVGVEYHKRFDTRSLAAKRACANGNFGDFVLGEAKLIEPYFYRSSNFQNWFTKDRTDPFVYIGCHYTDLLTFITGLRPVSVSVAGVEKNFPNGNAAYMWANARVVYENGGVLTVNAGLGYPDDAPGGNDQGMTLYFEGEGRTGMLRHDDHFRGVSHSYLNSVGTADRRFNYVNPDFFRYVPWEGDGYKPVGYGVDSVAASLKTIARFEDETAKLAENERNAARSSFLKRVDDAGLIATPANSSYNEALTEAARKSILNNGNTVEV